MALHFKLQIVSQIAQSQYISEFVSSRNAQSVYKLQCTMYDVQCTMYNVQYLNLNI